MFLDITSKLWMLAIDPGTSIVNTGDPTLIKAGDVTNGLALCSCCTPLGQSPCFSGSLGTHWSSVPFPYIYDIAQGSCLALIS